MITKWANFLKAILFDITSFVFNLLMWSLTRNPSSIFLVTVKFFLLTNLMTWGLKEFYIFQTSVLTKSCPDEFMSDFWAKYNNGTIKLPLCIWLYISPPPPKKKKLKNVNLVIINGSCIASLGCLDFGLLPPEMHKTFSMRPNFKF